MVSSYGNNLAWRINNPKLRHAAKKRNYEQTRKNAKKKRGPWSEADALAILAEDRPPDAQLSVLLGRSVQSIQVQRSKMRKARSSEVS